MRFAFSSGWVQGCPAGFLAAGAAAILGTSTLLAEPQPAPPPEPQRAAVVTHVSGASFLGIGVTEIDADHAKALNLREERGVEVTRIDDDGPAAKGGLKIGDVVLEF